MNQPIFSEGTSTHSLGSMGHNLGETTGLGHTHTHAHAHPGGFSNDEEFEEYEEMDPTTGVMVKRRRGLGTKIKDAVKGVFGGNKHRHEPKNI